MAIGNVGDIWRFLEDENEEPEYFLLIEQIPHRSGLEIYKNEERWRSIYMNLGQIEDVYIHSSENWWTKLA
jgi:hypothetical protein